MLTEIDKAGMSATALTRQLLAFSRKQIFEPKTISLNDLIIHLQKLLTRLIGEDIKLKLNLSPELGSCFADPGQMEQVLVNLVVNARDAMANGGTVLIETANIYFDESLAEMHAPLTTGQYLMLAVSDTGSGMSEEVKRHLFEPFFTTKAQGKGTGLGLATVYGVIRQTGGNVVVYSEPGHGTTFKIYLPRVARDAETLVRNEVEVERGNGELILVAEDEELLRNLVMRGLPEFGYRVAAFADGRSALEYLQSADSEWPVLLVTDVVMPEMNGRELAERVNELNPQLPVLFISGYTQDAIVTHGILQQEIRFLAKPFSVSTLAAKIGSIIVTENQHPAGD
jgi:CheY-like chemotaxis protein